MDDYINSVVGKPWVDRANGPDSFDCWGIVIDFFEKIHGDKIDVSGYESKNIDFYQGFYDQINKGIFVPADETDNGVVFTAFVKDTPTHIGVVIGDMCLHALGGNNVLGQVRYHKLRVMKRIYDRLEYYKYVG